MVIPLKWVVFMIYFHDCKERYLEKKMDEELGKDVRGVSEWEWIEVVSGYVATLICLNNNRYQYSIMNYDCIIFTSL